MWYYLYVQKRISENFLRFFTPCILSMDSLFKAIYFSLFVVDNKLIWLNLTSPNISCMFGYLKHLESAKKRYFSSTNHGNGDHLILLEGLSYFFKNWSEMLVDDIGVMSVLKVRISRKSDM